MIGELFDAAVDAVVAIFRPWMLAILLALVVIAIVIYAVAS